MSTAVLPKHAQISPLDGATSTSTTTTTTTATTAGITTPAAPTVPAGEPAEPTTAAPTTDAVITAAPTTQAVTTAVPATTPGKPVEPTTAAPTTQAVTTATSATTTGAPQPQTTAASVTTTHAVDIATTVSVSTTVDAFARTSIEFAEAGYSGVEGDEFKIRINKIGPLEPEVTFHLSEQNPFATPFGANGDVEALDEGVSVAFVGNALGPITIPAGDAFVEIALRIKPDSAPEGEEIFQISIANHRPVSVIYDADSRFVITIAASTANTTAGG